MLEINLERILKIDYKQQTGLKAHSKEIYFLRRLAFITFCARHYTCILSHTPIRSHHLFEFTRNIFLKDFIAI